MLFGEPQFENPSMPSAEKSEEIEKYGSKKLEILMQPEATSKKESLFFYGDSPVREMEYISAGIILSESRETIREALYISIENRQGDYFHELKRNYKHGYIQNEEDDKRLGLTDY